jgi:hypothetical protein
MSEIYTVGRCKPPLHTRFKKGQSGNPTGRPRREKRPPSIETALKKGLDQPVTVIEDGKRRQITKFEAVVAQLINKAASGHLPSLKLLMPFLLKFAEAVAEEDQEATAEAEAESYKRIRKRLDEMLQRRREAELLLGNPDLQTNGSIKTGEKRWTQGSG